MWLAITQDADDFPTSEALQLELYFHKIFTLHLFYQTLERRELGYWLIRPSRASRTYSSRAASFNGDATHDSATPWTVDQGGREGASSGSVGIEYRGAHLEYWLEGRIRWWGGSAGRRRGMRSYRRMARYYVEQVEPKLDAFTASLPEDLV